MAKRTSGGGTPPGLKPAAGKAALGGSGRDRVAALPVFSLGGGNRQTHLFAQGAANESAHRMRLPTGRLHELLQRGALRLPEHREHIGGLAAPARDCRRGRGLSLRFASLGRLLGPCALLSGRDLLGRRGLIGRDVRGLCADTAVQALNGLPDPGQCGFAIGELLNRGKTGDAIPATTLGHRIQRGRQARALKSSKAPQ